MTTNTGATQALDDTFLLGGDLPVRRLGLGAMRLTDAANDDPQSTQIWKEPRDTSNAITLLRRAVELGVQLIDTADAYALGKNEELIAQALYPYPEDLVIATKVGFVRPSKNEWVPLGNPAYLKQQVELGLRRLHVERIDLLQLHRVDKNFPLAEQVGTLAELRDEGKIRHLGLSEVSVDQLVEAQGIAPIASVQNLYNLSAHDHDPVVDYTSSENIAFLPYFPLAIGELARPGSVVDGIAQELGATSSQVALAWLLRRATNIIPIPGTASISHLKENLAATQVQLTDDQFHRISAV